MLLNGGAAEDSWESLGLQGDPTSQSKRKSVMNIHLKDWCWSWNYNTLATWWEEPLWCWERLRAGGEGGDRGWHGWKVSLTQWTWIWINSSCLTLRDPMDHSTPGLPVHHQLSEFTQTHVHWVGDAIQPSHPLLSPSPPAFNLFQHQGLFKWVRWTMY